MASDRRRPEPAPVRRFCRRVAGRAPADSERSTGGSATDGNGDGWANVYDPADAIPAAARMLTAHGAPGDIRRALTAYNGSPDYIDPVLAWAGRYADDGVQVAPANGDSACPPGMLAAVQVSGEVAGKVISYARTQLGKPYIWGAEGPDAYDCSGLTRRAYLQVGINLIHQSAAQAQQGTPVAFTTQPILPGDLVFLATRGNDVISHVGIALSDTTWIQARRPGDVVRVGPMPARSSIVAVRRLIPAG